MTRVSLGRLPLPAHWPCDLAEAEMGEETGERQQQKVPFAP